jgi:hypothetical protein
MVCDVCGLELAVLVWDEGTGMMKFVCRNRQCTRFGREIMIDERRFIDG